MTSVSISIDTLGAEKLFNNIVNKQVPFALKNTVNEVAYKAAKKILPPEANKTFKGGATPWTRRAFNYTKATKGKLYADIYINSDTHGYLRYQIEGGTRTPDRKKILVPSNKVKKNKYGNLTKSKRQSLFTNDKKYFVGAPAGKKSLGIWERYGGKRAPKVRMVAKFIKKARYKKKFPFVKTVQGVVDSDYKPAFKRHLKRALDSIK